MRHRSMLSNLLCSLALVIGVGQIAEARSVASDVRVLKNEQMEVVLDGQFPRVFEYRIPSRPKLLGAIGSDRPTVELNGTIYTPAEFTVTAQGGPKEVSYGMVFPKLGLTLNLVFQLEGNELLMKLTHVKESGSFRLNSFYFPDHFLIRMPALTPGAMMYRGEYERYPWKHPNYRGGYGNAAARFAIIAEEDGEQYPMQVNWAAAYGSGLAATIANNIGYWKLDSQFLGYSGRASDFALWNGTYYYRLRGKHRPLLESRIAVLTTDRNDDGKVDWMEPALWHRRLFPEPNRQYAGPAFTYKIVNAWIPPNNRPVLTTFEECLPIIQSIAQLTGGLPQIVFLVGWQYEGHDSGYPALDKVNPDLGGPEKLRWLAREAKKYNATIGYHINLEDAYPVYPGFDPSVLCLGLDGKPYPWCLYRGEHGPVAYHISHTKEIETGYFQKRAQAFLEAVPVEKAVHLDTFRYSNLSFGPNDFIGMNEELELGCKEIFKWFAERGIDISSEGPYDGFYGTLSWFLHRFVIADPFHLIMMHGKAYGGGKPLEPVGEVLGWSINLDLMAHPYKFSPSGLSLSEVSDFYYLGTLLQYYLNKKELLFLGPVGDEYVARFSGGTISRQKKGGPLLVNEGDVVIANGQDRMIPLNDAEIRLYSVSGGERTWTLPAGWSGREVELSELGTSARPPGKFRLDGKSLRLTMEPRQPYALHKR